MSALAAKVEQWVSDVRAKHAKGELAAADLEALLALARRPTRQRLLYLHALIPSIGAPLAGAALHEPRPGGVAQMDPMQQDPTYKSVHEAILDGWQVIHFPQQLAPFDDKEIDILGYEFILQKMETLDE
jgi:hypothetical protein